MVINIGEGLLNCIKINDSNIIKGDECSMVYSIVKGSIEIREQDVIQERILITGISSYNGKFKDTDFVVKMMKLFCEV